MKTLALILILSLSAGSSLAETTTVGYLKDGKIVIQDEDTARILDYSQDDKYSSPYKLKKWDVIEQLDPVNEALAVYKKKGEAPYSKKVYIIDRNDRTQKIVVEYESRDKGEHIFFTPDEGYVYYRDISGSGASVVMGVDLATGKKFFVAQSADFFLNTCPDKTTYVVVKDLSTDTASSYVIYSRTGDVVKTVVYEGEEDGISTAICQ